MEFHNPEGLAVVSYCSFTSSVLQGFAIHYVKLSEFMNNMILF